MPNHADDNRFFINEFDDSMDEIYLAVLAAMAVPALSKNRLKFYINSCGGDASRAMALVELMRRAEASGFIVETHVLYEAHSAGAMVAVAGTKGHRRVNPVGNYLLHWGEVDVTVRSPLESERAHKTNVEHFKNIKEHFLRHTDLTDDQLEEMMKADNYFLPANHAIALGFADGVV